MRWVVPAVRSEATVAVAHPVAPPEDLAGELGRRSHAVYAQAPQMADERAKIPFVGDFQHGDVVRLSGGGDDRRELAVPNEHIGHQQPRHAAVAVLERMDPDELVMEPPCLDLGGQIALGVAPVEIQQPIQLGADLLGRAVLVDVAVLPARVVGTDLVVAPAQRDLDPSPGEAFDPDGGRLMPGQELVERLEGVMAERTLSGRQVEDGLQRLVLVLEQTAQRVIREVAGHAVRATDPFESFGDELLGDAPPQVVEILDLAGLDGERALPLAEPDVHEGSVGALVLELLPRRLPLLDELAIGGQAPGLGLRGQITDRPPDGADRFRS